MMRHPYLGFTLIALVLVGLIVYTLLMHLELSAPVAYLIGINLATFLLYWYDMQISPAGEERARIPELVLLGLVFVGGTVGGILGIIFFRHKVNFRRHWDFQLGFLIIVAIQFMGIFCSPLGKPDTCNDLLSNLSAMMNGS